MGKLITAIVKNDLKRVQALLAEEYVELSLFNQETEETKQDTYIALFLAVFLGSERMVEILLERGVDLKNTIEPFFLSEIVIQQGYQARGKRLKQYGIDKIDSLCLAAWEGHERIALLLIEKDAQVNQSTKNGLTLLHLAAANGHMSIILELIKRGVQVNQADKHGGTPLYLAARNGHTLAVAELIKHGADVNQATKDGRTALHTAARNGHMSVIVKLIKHGANVNQATKDGRTALHTAARNGDTLVVAELINHGADVNQADKDGRTPLYLAAQEGHMSVIVELINHGAQVDQADNDWWTPLYTAARNGHTLVVAELIKHGANVNQTTKHGGTPLYLAARNGHTLIVAELIKHGVDVNQATKDGWTPLYLAAANGHMLVIVELINHGAQLQADNDGWTPLHLAAQKGHALVVAKLIKHGANVNQAEKDGWTPLHLAAQKGYALVVAKLIKRGADVNQAEKDGWTPLDLARDDSKIAALLLKSGAIIEASQTKFLYRYIREWLRSGEYKACLIVSERRLKESPGLRIDERVSAYYAQGQFDKAIDYLEELKSKDRKADQAFIFHRMGYIQMEQGKFDLAIKRYEAALREDKDYYWVHYDRMRIELYKTANLEAILHGLEELRAPKTFLVEKDLIYAYHVKGFIYHQCLQHEEALICFNEALRRNKKDIFALAKRGFLFFCQGEREKGLKDLDAALAINPYYSGALARKGYALAFKERFEDAEEYFKRSLQVNPNHFETLLLRGFSFILENRIKEAKQNLEKMFSVSVSRALLMAQHTPQKLKEIVGEYALEYSVNDESKLYSLKEKKEKLKEVLLTLARLDIFSEQNKKMIASYLVKINWGEELSTWLEDLPTGSPVYWAVRQIVLKYAKKQTEGGEQGAYFETKQCELHQQLEQLTTENKLKAEKKIIQKEISRLLKAGKPVDHLNDFLRACVEPSELSTKYDPSIFNNFKEKFLLTKLKDKMKAINRLTKHHSADYQNVTKSFKKIQEMYGQYREKINAVVNDATLSSKEKEKRLNKLSTPSSRFSTTRFREKHLEEVAKEYLESSEKDSFFGTHTVRQYKGIHFKYHTRGNLCYPAIDYMVGALYGVVAGPSYGVAPTEIAKIHRSGEGQVLMASQTAKGINLHIFLKHYVEYINKIDLYNFSTIIITSLLTNPADAKPDNHIIQFVGNSNGEDNLKIVAIDNDLAFANPIIKIHQGERAGQHVIGVKSVFYFFPQMTKAIHPDIRRRLIEQLPEELLLEFIKLLQKKDKDYKKLLRKGILTAEEGKNLQLPICFSRETMLVELCEKLKKIQVHLQSRDGLTHEELFHAIYPEMAAYYEVIAKKNEGEDAILKGICALYEPLRLTLEDAGIILGEMSQQAIETMKADEYSNRPYSLLQAIEKFVESIDFKSVSLENQPILLRELKELKSLERLTLRHCEKLNDTLLRGLVNALPELKIIHLIGCSNVTPQGIQCIQGIKRKLDIRLIEREGGYVLPLLLSGGLAKPLSKNEAEENSKGKEEEKDVSVLRR